MSYHSATYNHPSFIKRFAHRSRIKKAISLVDNDSNFVLDYGCGQGYFIDALVKSSSQNVIGYDAFMKSSNIRIFNDWDKIPRTHNYDLITCFEVLEHCKEDEILKILSRFDAVLKEDG